MEVIFTSTALSHIEEWKKSGNVGVQKKINELLSSMKETPFEGGRKARSIKA